MDPSTFALAAGVLLAGTAGTLLRRAGLARARARAAIFDDVAPGFDDARLILAPDGFARLTGLRHGRRFELRVLPDGLSMRKLPALWLIVTLTEPQPLRGTTDILLRPMGGEPFSPFARLPQALPLPPGAPAEAAMRCDRPDAPPDFSVLARHVGLLHEAGAKELLIGPAGLRLVWLAQEADRGRYLLFRDGELGQSPLPRALAERLADALLALDDDLSASPEVARKIA
jgi:hypothetical protein